MGLSFRVCDPRSGILGRELINAQLDGAPLEITEFTAHNSRLQFGSLKSTAAAVNTLDHVAPNWFHDRSLASVQWAPRNGWASPCERGRRLSSLFFSGPIFRQCHQRSGAQFPHITLAFAGCRDNSMGHDFVHYCTFAIITTGASRADDYGCVERIETSEVAPGDLNRSTQH